MFVLFIGIAVEAIWSNDFMVGAGPAGGVRLPWANAESGKLSHAAKQQTKSRELDWRTSRVCKAERKRRPKEEQVIFIGGIQLGHQVWIGYAFGYAAVAESRNKNRQEKD